MDLTEQIKALQEQFYEKNDKKRIFKKNQKYECATSIQQSIPVSTMLEHSIYILPNTNKIIFNYTIFKTFMNPDVFQPFVVRAFNLCNETITNNGTFCVHLNIQGSTISGFQRFKPIIELFLKKVDELNFDYKQYLEHASFYYPPSIMTNLLSLLYPMLEKEVMAKLIVINKETSETEWNKVIAR